MPLTDAEITRLIELGASDDEIRALDAEGAPAKQPSGGINGNTSNLSANPMGVASNKPAGFTGANVLEPTASLVTGALAEPIAGLAGIAQTLNPFASKGAGARAVEATRNALTYSPKTQNGQSGLETVGDVVAPIAETISGAENYLGDKTLEATGSPALASAAKTIPTLGLELVGMASGKGAVSSAGKIKKGVEEGKLIREIHEAAPSIEQLKDTSRAVYKEIDDMGATLKPRVYKDLVSKLTMDAKKMGLDKDITPDSMNALKRFHEIVGDSPKLSDIDTLRKVAQNAAGSIKKTDSAIASNMVHTIDNYLDTLEAKHFKQGADQAADIGTRYKVARDLWGRARRSETLNEAFDKARLQASGFENGLRTQFRSLLNNKKTAKMFNASEREAMKKVVLGTKTENLAKLVGRLGFSEGSATNILGGGAGVAAGAYAGGPIGAVAVPVIGQVSRKLAQRMTAKNAEYADEVIRAGKDARKITAAYMRNTPKAERSAQELSELLMKRDTDFSNLPKNAFTDEAIKIVESRKAPLAGAFVVAPNQNTEEQ